MSVVQDPNSTLEFYDLSHEWGHGAPALPGYPDVKLYRSSQHAKNGVMAHRFRMVMHSGTHLNAPRHLVQKGAGVGDIEMDRLFGNGCVLSIPKKDWELVTAAHLSTLRRSAGDCADAAGRSRPVVSDIAAAHPGRHVPRAGRPGGGDRLRCRAVPRTASEGASLERCERVRESC